MQHLTQTSKQSRAPHILAALLITTSLATIPAHAAGLLVADGPFGGALEQTQHNVTVTINNNIAVTEVEQTFRNTERRTLEALYTFPVPENASVANFTMWINGQEMVGEVLEKQRAREIYNTYKQQARPRDPGLLEQVDYKTFELRIFPIPAEAEQRVRIVYYQKLDTDHDWSTYTYPLATTTRAGLDSTIADRFSLNLRVLSETPIDKTESPSHDQQFVFTTRDQNLHEASLELTGGNGSVEKDIVLAYHTTRPQTGLDLITSRPENEDGYFMLTLTAGDELAKLDLPMDYVFILDISGSMAHDQKLRLSTSSLNAFIQALAPDDRFEVITFNVTPDTLFNTLNPADNTNKTNAADYLNSREARGGTDLAPAIQTAFKYGQPDRPLNIVILSDGMTEQADSRTLIQTASSRPANATIFTIGVGNEVNRRTLEQLAEKTGGLADFISRGDNFNRRADAFRRKLTRPVATNLNINIAGIETYDVEPATLPNLFHGTPVQIIGRYKGNGPAQANVQAEIAGRPITSTTKLAFPTRNDTASQNPEIERMWALARVDRLLKEADEHNARSGVTDEIIRLGEAYSIVTEYTSFIVLENDAEYKRWNIDRRNALRVVRDQKRRTQLNAEIQQRRDESLANLGPVVASNNNTTSTSAAPQRNGDLNLTPSTNRSSGGNSGGGSNSAGGGRSSGAGAIDPITATVALALLGSGTLAAKRRKRLFHNN